MKLFTATSTTQDPAVRGRELGLEFGDRFEHVSGLYLDHFAALKIPGETVRRIAEASHAALAGWAPGLAAEAEAIASAAGLELWRLAAVGARTEILAAEPPRGEGECSTAVLTGADHAPETLQTWDWHEFLVPDGLLLDLTTQTGRRVKLFTEFGTAAKIGVNDAGLGLHFNILSHRSDSDQGGVPVHAIARRILEEAATVEEAQAIAASATVSASTVFTVFDFHDGGSRAVSLELAPAGLGVVRPARTAGCSTPTTSSITTSSRATPCPPTPPPPSAISISMPSAEISRAWRPSNGPVRRAAAKDPPPPSACPRTPPSPSSISGAPC